MSKELVGGLVAVALLLPYIIASIGPGLVEGNHSVLLRIGLGIIYVASIGFFVVMGFKGGDTFHSSFWVYWAFGGWLIWQDFWNIGKIVGSYPEKN